MDAHGVLLQACQRQDGFTKQKNASNYFATALPSKRTRPITLQRLYQTKERVQLLCNGFTKQKNASNYFATALPSKRTRPITFERRYQAKERVQLLLNGVTKQKNANNYFETAFSRHSLDPIRFSRSVTGRFAVQPVQFEQLVEFISRQPKKDCRPAPIAVALFQGGKKKLV